MATAFQWLAIALLLWINQASADTVDSAAPVPVLESNVSALSLDTTEDVKYCKKLVPGLGRMSQGLDIAALDLFPPDVTMPNGFVQPLFEYTCNQERAWYDPLNPSESYDIPDQVESISNVPAGSLNIAVRHNENMQQLKSSMGAKVGLDVEAGMFGSFSASASYTESKENMLKTEKTVAEVS